MSKNTCAAEKCSEEIACATEYSAWMRISSKSGIDLNMHISHSGTLCKIPLALKYVLRAKLLESMSWTLFTPGPARTLPVIPTNAMQHHYPLTCSLLARPFPDKCACARRWSSCANSKCACASFPAW